jgi:hypothetical protein
MVVSKVFTPSTAGIKPLPNSVEVILVQAAVVNKMTTNKIAILRSVEDECMFWKLLARKVVVQF